MAVGHRYRKSLDLFFSLFRTITSRSGKFHSLQAGQVSVINKDFFIPLLPIAFFTSFLLVRHSLSLILLFDWGHSSHRSNLTQINTIPLRWITFDITIVRKPKEKRAQSVLQRNQAYSIGHKQEPTASLCEISRCQESREGTGTHNPLAKQVFQQRKRSGIKAFQVHCSVVNCSIENLKCQIQRTTHNGISGGTQIRFPTCGTILKRQHRWPRAKTKRA